MQEAGPGFPDSPLQSQAAQISTINLGDTDPSRPIDADTALLGVRGKVSPCLGLVQQLPQICSEISTGMLA